MEKPVKILIVDDDRIVCDDLVETLSSHGYQIAGCAGSGRTAIDLAKQTPPGSNHYGRKARLQVVDHITYVNKPYTEKELISRIEAALTTKSDG